MANKPVVCYNKAPACSVDQAHYQEQKERALKNNVESFLVPKRSGKAWAVNEGDLVRISVVEGSQVGDLNLWNRNNTKERFYSSKTRLLHSGHLGLYDRLWSLDFQRSNKCKTRLLHSGHLGLYDRLWSCLPYLRPMATIVTDTCNYAIDSDGSGMHDVCGSRCDQYTYKLITGKEKLVSCHYNLTEAVKEFGLKEEDVHDVLNVFMLTGFTADTHQFFTKGTSAKPGDYIELIADMDLIMAMSSCPLGDVSMPVGEEMPEDRCHPLQVDIYRPDKK